MSRYKKSQYARQEDLINNSDIFNGDKGNGYFMGKARPFVLRDGMNNLYQPIRNDVLGYFTENNISWWGGGKPSVHTLSSQIACLNHLFAENVVKLKEEKLKADNYMHIHVIPSVNKDLLDKKYSVSGMTMEETWRSMLNDQSKYIIVDPRSLFAPIIDKYPELSSYLEKRYW